VELEAIREEGLRRGQAGRGDQVEVRREVLGEGLWGRFWEGLAVEGRSTDAGRRLWRAGAIQKVRAGEGELKRAAFGRQGRDH